jgi:hypothetical protein
MRPTSLAGKTLMKKFFIGLLLVVFSSVPSLAQAQVESTSQAAASEGDLNRMGQPAQLDVSPGSAVDYAAREAAAPELAGFAGGGGGIYIGSGAVIVVLLVILIVIVLR